ncbi:MAG TPA: P22 coat - protein 5 family protein [Gammaproteobacteria bacterium]|jgi:hypothetical protein|nr:P22 coat - protein 5 family protein [Gammaproteobacteria bacterium]
MANVLTNLANDIMIAADQVGREAVGFIPSVTINSGSEEAAQGDTVRSFVTPAATVNTSATPSMTIPEGDDQTVTTKTMALDQIASVRIPWTGEDIKHVNNGSGFETVYGDQIKQAMKGITNSIESHIATIAYQGASRAVGTAGTTPFSSNHDTVAEARQIIFDNGIPVDDNRLSLILNSNAGTNLRNLAVLQKANESGNDSLLRQGTLLDLQGAMVKESGQVVSHTKGTGASYIVNDASSAIGDTTIATDTGSGTILAGDIVTFNADTTNKYVVNTALSGGSFVIGDTGLRQAAVDNEAITVGNSFAANVMLHQSGVELAMRPLAKPAGGDAAVDVMTVEDPFSGLVYQISFYKGYNKAMIDITVLYKAKVWNSDAISLLIG